MKILTTCLLIFSLSSCAFYTGYTTSNVSYNGSNAEVIDIVSAKTSVTRILGLGGTDREAIILETKRKMYRQNPLKKGQVYANMGVDVKNAFYLIANIETFTVSADVIQFYEDTTEHMVFSKLARKTTSYDNEKTVNSSTSVGFSGQSPVYFLDNKEVKKGKIVSILDDLLKVKTENGDSFYVDLIKCFHIIDYSKESELKEVRFQDGESIVKALVVGYNDKALVVKQDNQLRVIKKKSVFNWQG